MSSRHQMGGTAGSAEREQTSSRRGQGQRQRSWIGTDLDLWPSHRVITLTTTTAPPSRDKRHPPRARATAAPSRHRVNASTAWVASIAATEADGRRHRASLTSTTTTMRPASAGQQTAAGMHHAIASRMGLSGCGNRPLPCKIANGTTGVDNVEVGGARYRLGLALRPVMR